MSSRMWCDHTLQKPSVSQNQPQSLRKPEQEEEMKLKASGQEQTYSSTNTKQKITQVNVIIFILYNILSISGCYYHHVYTTCQDVREGREIAHFLCIPTKNLQLACQLSLGQLLIKSTSEFNKKLAIDKPVRNPGKALHQAPFEKKANTLTS